MKITLKFTDPREIKKATSEESGDGEAVENGVMEVDCEDGGERGGVGGYSPLQWRTALCGGG